MLAAARGVASLFLVAHPDSGCTGSMTPDASMLINVKPCSDTFRAANRVTAKATCIGDLPVLAKTDSDKLRFLIFKNVRCVPAFSYTLLSVRQMWREQRIDSLFADTLALATPEGDRIPFLLDKDLPTIRLVSAARLAQAAKTLGTGRDRPASLVSTLGGGALPTVATPAGANAPLMSPKNSRTFARTIAPVTEIVVSGSARPRPPHTRLQGRRVTAVESQGSSEPANQSSPRNRDLVGTGDFLPSGSPALNPPTTSRPPVTSRAPALASATASELALPMRI